MKMKVILTNIDQFFYLHISLFQYIFYSLRNFKVARLNVELIMPPFKEEGYIVLLMSVGQYVGRKVDQIVSADYLKYRSS